MTLKGLIKGFFGVYRFFKATPDAVIHNADDSGRVVLRDGRDYRVDVTDATFAVTHKTSSDVCTMAWSEVTRVTIFTIDNFPIAHVSFMLHGSAGDAIEVPWDADGNGAFLNAMQKKLTGFDNDAVSQALSMLHGVTQVWPPAAAMTSPECVSPSTSRARYCA